MSQVHRLSAGVLRDERGVVYLEFLIVFVPIWTFCLCVFQVTQIAQADLIVRHAAEAAARSASVVLPDDPSEYGGEPERSIAPNQVTLGSLRADVASVADALSSSNPSGRVLANLGRSRLNTIRLAAHVPLMPLTPSGLGSLAKTTLRGALGGFRAAASAPLHQPLALAVTFPNAEGDWITGPEVRVRVTYAFECLVPLARQIVCSAFDATRSRTDELQHVFLPVAQGLLGGRFRRLQHDAQAMIQDAPYEYQPRSS